MGTFSEIIKMRVDDLKEHPANREFFNQPTVEEVKELEQSLKELGQINPIVINEKNEILAGHQRWKVAKELLKWSHIDVRVFKGTPKEEIEILIDDNLKRRYIKPECYVKIAKNKYKFLPKETLINFPHIPETIRAFLQEYKDKMSKDLLAYFVSLSPGEQILTLQELETIFKLQEEKTDEILNELLPESKEITRKDIEEYKIIKKDNISDKFKENEKKLIKLQNEFRLAEERIESLQNELEVKEQEISQLQKEKIILQDKLEKLLSAENIDQLPEKIKETILELQNKVKDYEQTVKNKEKEFNEMKAELLATKTKYQNLIDEKDRLVNEQAREMKEKYREMYDKVKKQKEEIDKLIEEKDKKIMELKEQLQNKVFTTDVKLLEMEVTEMNSIYFAMFFLRNKIEYAMGKIITFVEQEKQKGNENQDINEIIKINGLEKAETFFKHVSETVYMLTANLIQFQKLTKVLGSDRMKKFKQELINILEEI